MPGKRATIDQERRFWMLTIERGVSWARAAEIVGMSRNWGWRKWSAVHGSSAAEDRRRAAKELPDPKDLDALDGGVRDLLRPEGFNAFCEAFLCRRPSPWRQDAARRVVDALVDRQERHYIVLNVFPGSGKTTLLHDIECWLICGGGVERPAVGRALRLMVGSEVMRVATHFSERLRRTLDLRRPFYDKEQRREAELTLGWEFGRFRPQAAIGEDSLWRREQFLVAQITDVDLYEKEPTVQAASRESGFLGERVDLAVWDDLATRKNSRGPEIAEELAVWFADEAETRVEPGGVLLLVGQRLNTLDVYRNRLDFRYIDATGAQTPKYHHIVYPAHHEELCDGEHRQWDGGADGCLTDEHRLPWREVAKLTGQPNFRTVYQQEDADPSSVLVLPIWLDGGEDHTGYPAPGCYDRDRAFLEHPSGVSGLIDYVTVDPSVSNWWAIEWWAVHPKTRHRYLIWGARRKMQAGGLLDWDYAAGRFVGLMDELQRSSIAGGHPIRVWVIEANAAHRYLFQFDHYRRWRQAFPLVHVIPHTTQVNKTDAEFGVEATIPMAYRTGFKHLPRRPGTDGLNYINVKVKELTTYPHGQTDDTVMADWFGEANLERIIRSAVRSRDEDYLQPDQRMPGYLSRQVREIPTGDDPYAA